MIKQLKPKSEFGRNILLLMTGTSIAQAITLAFIPILTRIYTPDDFGLVAIYVSLASLVSLVATGRYEMAILVANDQQESDDLTLISILIGLSISLLSLLIIFLFGQEICNLVGSNDIKPWLFFIPISVLFTGIYQSFNYWLTRKKAFKVVSKGRVVSSSMNTLTAAFIGMSLPTINGLIIGGVFSNILAAFYYGKAVLLQGIRPNLYKGRARWLLKKHYRFPLFQLPNALVDGVRQNIINVMIGRFFGIDTLGFYSLGLKVLMLPSTLIGGAISQVFYQKLSEMHNSQISTFKFVRNFVLKAMFFSWPFYLLLYYFSVDLFSFMFGDKWQVSGEIVRELVPWFYLMFISSTISTVFIILGRQGYLLLLSIIYLLVPIFSIYESSGDLFGALSLMNSGMSIVLLIMIFLALRASYSEDKKQQKRGLQ